MPKTGLAPAASARASAASTEAPGAASLSATGTFALALLILAAWLLTRPYQGIIQDSEFYTVQALHALLPGRYAGDLYFRYGSQDQFTLFTRVYAPFVAWFGLAPANLILTVAGECLWLGGLIYMTRRIFPDRRMMFVALAAAILLPGGSFLRYGEAFLTPRLYAEALTLWAFGSMLRGRPLRALLILCVSVTIHPLMTLPGLAVLFFYQAAGQRVWWACAVLAASAACGLGLCGVQPFSRLFQSFDPAWFAVVTKRDSFCFLTHWDAVEWMPVANDFALAVLGIVVARPEERRLIVTVFAVTSGALLVSFIGADVLRNVLIADAQLWRACEFLGVIANLYVAPMLWRIRGRERLFFINPRALLLTSLGLLALSNFVMGICMMSGPIAVVAAIAVAWERQDRAMRSQARRLVLTLAVGVICGLTFVIVQLSLADLAIVPKAVWEAAGEICLTAAIAGAIAACVCRPRWLDWLNRHAGAAAGLAAGLLVLTASGWDRQKPWVHFIDTTSPPPASLVKLLPGSEPVYWEGDVDVPWFLLRTESYFSCAQGTGALFSRGTAMEFQARFESFQPLDTLDFGPAPFCPRPRLRQAPTRAALAEVCDREPGLGGLVLVDDVADAPKKVWVSPVDYEYGKLSDGKPGDFATKRFYIYSCAQLR